MKSTILTLDQALERPRLSLFSISALLLCAAITMVDGYDIQAAAMAAPFVVAAWSLSPQIVGLVLAASIVGIALGSMVLAPLADRVGRRPMILLSLFFTGVLTLAAAAAADAVSLIALRFLAGLGLGGAMPNLVVMSLEYAPRRMRTIAVALIGTGYPLGAAVGGAFAGRLGTMHGWPAIFLLGGAATLAIAVLGALFLPESPYFLAQRPDQGAKLRRLLRRINPSLPGEETWTVSQLDRPLRTAPLSALFGSERRLGTALFWVTYFSNMALLYFFISWLPSLFTYHGFPIESAINASATFNAGAVIGAVVMAAIIDRLPTAPVLGPAYLGAGIVVILLGFVGSASIGFFAAVFLAGVLIAGSQLCLAAKVGQYYPSEMRATGLGFANGVGRLGAVVAPAIGGVLIAAMPDMQKTFMFTAILAFAACAAILIIDLSSIGRSRAQTGRQDNCTSQATRRIRTS